MSLVFETIEDILGINVIKPTEVSGGSASHSDEVALNKLIKTKDNIKFHIVTIEKLKNDLIYVTDILSGVCIRSTVNKVLVNSINETFPELLSVTANINDFTDIPSKTNVSIVINFLENRVSIIKDELIIVHNELIKLLEDIKITIKLNTNLYEEMECNKDLITHDIIEFSTDKRLQVFKDGELYKLYTYVLNDKVIEIVKLTTFIDNLDINKLVIAKDAVFKLLHMLESIDSSVGINTASNYDQVLIFLSKLNINDLIDEYNTANNIITSILNERKLLVDINSYRKDLVNVILKTNDISKLDTIVNNIAKILCICSIYVNSGELNTIMLRS